MTHFLWIAFVFSRKQLIKSENEGGRLKGRCEITAAESEKMNLVVNVGLLVSAECPFEICGETFKVIPISMLCAATGIKLNLI